MEFGTLNFLELSPEILRYLRSEGYTGLAQVKLPSAGSAGSGRKYYRLQFAQRSYVLQQSFAADQDFHRFIQYAQVFSNLGLQNPEIYAFCPERFQVLMEDLGSQDLLSRAQLAFYPQVLEALFRWQQHSDAAFELLPELVERSFDFASLRWETEYFQEFFWQNQLNLNSCPAMELWFEQLAQRVALHPQVLMHRDFQSQNIMLTPQVRIIDFQGARRGSAFYDLASLLWDPYTMLTPATVAELFAVWQGFNHAFAMQNASQCFLDAALQRMMQALGAFAKLSKSLSGKNADFFAGQIPRGVARLQSLLSQLPTDDWGRADFLPQLEKAL